MTVYLLLAWLQISLITLLWYWRLGHPSLQKLRPVTPIESSVSTLGCVLVSWVKHHRVSFLNRVNNHNSSALEFVHSHIRGPCRVPSVKSFRYFLFFVDDFSRTTWLYLLKGMSKVFGVIETFFNEIKNQFFTSIRVLRTDNT